MNTSLATSTPLDEALTEYSAGKISRHELESRTGLWFGDVLLEMAKRNLQLPRFNPFERYSPQQKAIYAQLLGLG